MANVTQWLNDLKQRQNKGQGHSFWYQSITHIRLSIGCQSIVTFALGRTVLLLYITSQTTDATLYGRLKISSNRHHDTV